MSSTPIEKLVKQAREDPSFFHDLVFNTEKALGKIDYLDRPTKGAILAINPEEVISWIAGGAIGTGGGMARGVQCRCTYSGAFFPAVQVPGETETRCSNTCGSSCNWT